MTESGGTVLATTMADGWRHYLRLGVNSFATMLDLGLYALGAALIGLGLSLLLAGLGVVDAATNLSTGAGLVSALVLGVTGTFLMGIASEGPVRRNSPVEARSEVEQAVARAAAAAVVGALLVLAAGRLESFAGDVPAPLAMGIELIRVAGLAGLWPVPLIGVPLAWGAHRSGLFGEWAVETDLPIMFAVWVVALILLRG